LYLEWAPLGIMNKKKKEKKVIKEDGVKKLIKKEEENEQGHSLYIKNLNFKTTESDLEKIFSEIGEIKSLKLIKDGEKSKGFAFLEYKNLNDAIKAHDSLNHQVIDEHQIQIQYSNISKDSKTLKQKESFYIDKNGKKVSFKKLVLKNIPFEATKRDLYELFTPFGKLKVLRLPSNIKGGHRGFAFVEFLSSTDCYNAYEALRNTHLYGRHIVIEFAADDEENELNKKNENLVVSHKRKNDNSDLENSSKKFKNE
jgi:multiple RNA-binding domain-containing protein 1